MSSLILFLLAVISSAACAIGAIANLGPDTLSSSRDSLEDAAFKIGFPSGVGTTSKSNYVTQEANVGTDAILGAADVQAALQRVVLRSQRSFPTHSHPRAGETLYLQKGNLEVFFRMEGNTPKVVKNTVLAGQASVVPVGLAHGAKCISFSDCVYVTHFTSSDPGFVALPGK